MSKKKVLTAVLLTMVVIVSARRFGPNHQYRVEAAGPGFTLSHKAPRGHSGEGPAEVVMKVVFDDADKAQAPFRACVKGKVQGAGEWETVHHSRIETDREDCDKAYVFGLPCQPPATRYMYRFEGCFEHSGSTPVVLAKADGIPMTLKFKGDVPAWIMIPHVLSMFAGFFVLILAALYGLDLGRGRDSDEKKNPAHKLAWLAWIILFIGGVPIGFAMNIYAFDVVWEAFPFGSDVTDNKTQVALVLWGAAAVWLSTSRKRRRAAGLFAALAGLLVLAIYLIPHSM